MADDNTKVKTDDVKEKVAAATDAIVNKVEEVKDAVVEKVADKVLEVTADKEPVEKAANVNLSDNAKKIMDIVEKMTVLELSDLVKALEDKFGVSAAAPAAVAVAGAPAGEAAAPAEEKSNYDVVLVSGGDTKIAVIKVVRELDQTLGLVDAKNLVDKGDAVLLTQAKKEAAEEAKAKLEAAGAKVELR